MKNEKIHFGYDISMERGPVLRPSYFKFWESNKAFAKVPSRAPLKYQADALLGCSYLALNSENGHSRSKECQNLWLQIEAHVSLFNECQNRVQAMAKYGDTFSTNSLKSFEKNFMETLNHCLKPDGVDLQELTGLVDSIHYLETEMKTPLLYNFNCVFSNEFNKTLQALESFLFHLRTLVAVDYNNHIEDPSHEALKVDSVTDYLPKADYIVSDAVLYWQVQKIMAPYSTGTRSDVRIEKLMVEPIANAFKQYAHNATYLVDHLPKSFLNALKPSELEEALHLVQIDWLLGCGTGLLFKIREELYGLQHGYEKIFWPELENKPNLKAAHLSLNLEFSPNQILGIKKTA